MCFVRCVNRDEHCADFCCRPECKEPFGDVCCPYCNVMSRSYAEGNKRSGNTVNITSELRICSRVVERRISERCLIRICFRKGVEYLTESFFENIVFLPRKNASRDSLGMFRMKFRSEYGISISITVKTPYPFVCVNRRCWYYMY